VAACDAHTCEVTWLLSIQLHKAAGKAGEVQVRHLQGDSSAHSRKGIACGCAVSM
jgi:hypothetical protein